MSIPGHSNDGAAWTVAGDHKSRLPRRGEGDDGRSILLEGGIDSCYGNGLDGGGWGAREATQLTKHDTVEHGRLSLKTDLTHDTYSLGRVLACKENQEEICNNAIAYEPLYIRM